MKKLLLLFVVWVELVNAQTWVSVGGGVNGFINSQAILNNELYVNVELSSYGDSSFLKKWDGFTWTTLCPMDYQAKLASYNNNIYTAFIDSNSQCIVARFNGSSWDTIGISNLVSTQVSNHEYVTMEVFNNELYVGSGFTQINGVNANRIAKWNNSTWSAVGNGLDEQPVGFLSYNNNLYIAGEFTTAGNISAKNIAKWNGTDWDSLGSGLLPYFPGSSPDGDYFGGLVFYNNDLYVSAEYVWGTPGHMNVLTDSITKWDGTQWTSFPSDFQRIALFNNELYFIKYLTKGRYLRTFDGVNLTTEIIDNTIIDTMFVFDFFVFNDELFATGEIITNGWNHEGIVKLYDPIVSVDKGKINSDFTIYPNPASDKLTIETSSSGSIYQLQDITGKQLMQGNISAAKFNLDISALSKGIYLLRIFDGDRVAHRKIVKE